MANGLKKQKQKWKALAKHKSSLVLYLITILSAAITVFVLGYLIVYILANGIPHLKPSLFAFTYTSDNVSMMPALINTVLMTLATLIVAVPLGIFAAIYLVEYAKKGNKLVSIIRVTAETLTGIPSIVYGLFGMLFFVGYCKCCVKLVSNHFSRTREVLIFLSLFANVWHKSYVTCSLDCYCKSSLVFCTVACDSARKNFSSLRDVSL